MIIAVCGQKVGRQDALRTIPLSKVRRPIEIRYDAIAGSARICAHTFAAHHETSVRGGGDRLAVAHQHKVEHLVPYLEIHTSATSSA